MIKNELDSAFTAMNYLSLTGKIMILFKKIYDQNKQEKILSQMHKMKSMVKDLNFFLGVD